MVISVLGGFNLMVIKKVMDDLKFWVSVVMELYIMCIDVFLEVSFEDGKWIE